MSSLGILDKAAIKVKQAGAGSGKKGGFKAKTHHFFYVLVWLMGLVAPPVAVLIRFGIGRDFFINIICTICGYFPGHFHNFYCQTIRNNRNKARTPKWAVRYGLVAVEDKRGGKHQWAGRYDERLPDSSRYGYGDDDLPPNVAVAAADWDGRGPEPPASASSQPRRTGIGRFNPNARDDDDDHHHHFAPWSRTVDPSEVEGGPPPPPEDGRGGRREDERAFDPLTNESFYESTSNDVQGGGGGPNQSGMGRKPSFKFGGGGGGGGSLGGGGGGSKKKSGFKGILGNRRSRYEDTSSGSSYTHNNSSNDGDRFDRMNAARGGEDEYQDEFERELNMGSSASASRSQSQSNPRRDTASASSKPAPTSRYSDLDDGGVEDAWGSASSTAAARVQPQRTGTSQAAARMQPTRTGSGSSNTEAWGRDSPGPLQAQKTGGVVQGSKEDNDLFSHTF